MTGLAAYMPDGYTADTVSGEKLGEVAKRRRTVEEDIRRTVHEERKGPHDVG